MAVFMPASGTELVHADESQTGVSAEVTVTSVMPDLIESIYWISDPELPQQAVVTTSIEGEGAKLTINFPDFIGMIPVLAIDYLLDGELETVTDWADVPDEATEIISYLKQPSDGFTYTLTVTVVEQVAGESGATYTLVIDPEYTAGRDALIAAVQARS